MFQFYDWLGSIGGVTRILKRGVNLFFGTYIQLTASIAVMNGLYHSHDTDKDPNHAHEHHAHAFNPDAYEGGEPSDHHNHNHDHQNGESVKDELEELYGGDTWGHFKLSTGIKAYISFLTLFKLLPMAKKTNRKLRMIMDKVDRGNVKIKK